MASLRFALGDAVQCNVVSPPPSPRPPALLRSASAAAVHPARCCWQPDAGDAAALRRWQGQWEPGTVVKLNYREKDWPEGRRAAYQVKLDNGTYIYAPKDDNNFIKPRDGVRAPAFTAAHSPPLLVASRGRA